MTSILLASIDWVYSIHVPITSCDLVWLQGSHAFVGSGAFTPEGEFFQYAFMDDSNAWLRALQQV